jgi:hypothetical protein
VSEQWIGTPYEDRLGAEDGATGLYKAGLYFTCLELSQVLGIWCFSAFNAEFGVGFCSVSPGRRVFPLAGQWVMTAYDCEGDIAEVTQDRCKGVMLMAAICCAFAVTTCA